MTDDFDDEEPTFPPEVEREPALDLGLDPVELGFLDRIRTSPDDFALRVVYADWLEQQGDLRKAELVRLLSVSPRDPSPELERLRELGSHRGSDWIAILARTSIDGCEQATGRRCLQRWESLASTDQPRVRWCRKCEGKVLFCNSIEIVQQQARSGPRDRVAYSPLLNEDAMAVYDGCLSFPPGRDAELRERRALRTRILDGD